MNSRMVFCLALVALMAFGSVHGLTGDKSLEASASLDLSLSKGEALAAAAQANPSAPPAESTILLAAHKLDIDVDTKKTKQPLLTVSEAPCKNICHDKCELKMEKHCLTVDVPKKDCKMTSKTVTKQHCQKKCKPALVPKAENTPNPSAPAALTASTPLELPLSKSKSVDLSFTAGKHNLSAALGLPAATEVSVSKHSLSAAPGLSSAAEVSASKHDLSAEVELTAEANIEDSKEQNGRRLQGILLAGAKVVNEVKKGAVKL